jgi:hypothetical protein
MLAGDRLAGIEYSLPQRTLKCAADRALWTDLNMLVAWVARGNAPL